MPARPATTNNSSVTILRRSTGIKPLLHLLFPSRSSQEPPKNTKKPSTGSQGSSQFSVVGGKEVPARCQYQLLLRTDNCKATLSLSLPVPVHASTRADRSPGRTLPQLPPLQIRP